MKRLTFPAALALIILASNGCDRKEAGVPQSKPTAPLAPVPSADSIPVQKAATPNDFKRAARQLDIGGNFLIYWSVDQIIAQAESAATDLKESAKLQTDSAKELEGIEKGWEFLSQLARGSGATSIESVSASAIELEPKLFRAKTFISRKPGANGLIWEFPGRAPHELDFLKMLPAETAFAQTLDYDLRKIWNSLADSVKDIPNGPEELAEFPAEFEKSTGMNWETFLNESGGEVALALTLHPANKLRVPIPEEGVAPVEIPEPGLVLAFRVRGTAVFDRIDKAAKDIPHTASDRNGVKIRVGPGGEYEGMRYSPTVAQAGEWLIITSREDILNQMLEVSAAKIPSLLQNPAFQRLMKYAAPKSNGMTYLGKNLSAALENFQLAATQSEDWNKITASMRKRILELLRLPEKLVTVEFGEDGIVVTEVGDAAMPSSSIAGPAAFILPVAAAIGIPAYMRQQQLRHNILAEPQPATEE